MADKQKSYDEIFSMICDSCCKHFYNGAKDIKETIVNCATQIYIAQMKEGADNDN